MLKFYQKVLIFLVVLGFGVGNHAFSQETSRITDFNNPSNFKKPASSSKIDHTLNDLFTGSLGFADVADLIPVSGNRVSVELISIDSAASLRAPLAALGFEEQAAFGTMISGTIPVSNLDKLGSINKLVAARPAYKPYIAPLTDIEAIKNATNPGGRPLFGGSVISEAVFGHKVDVVQDKYKLFGQGVTIGVLSDSYNSLGGAAAGMASGDLPSNGRPFASSRPVQVLSDLAPGAGTDEGRAMLELVHDVAPGANLAFASAFIGGIPGFAQSIIDLRRKANCDVIVDDVIYFAEPMFQDGLIAQAANQVSASGASFFSSAGNSGNRSFEDDFRPLPPVFIAGFGWYQLHDYTDGGGANLLTLAHIGQNIFSFQWSDPFASNCPGCPGAENDLDVLVFPTTSTAIVGGGFSANIGGDAIELFAVNAAGVYQRRYAIGRWLGDNPAGPDPVLLAKPAPRRIKFVIFGGASSNPTLGRPLTSSSYGHANAGGAISVAAADYRQTPVYGVNPPVVESFSSQGGLGIYYGITGNPLSQPLIRNKPEITAIDGTSNTFFGSAGDALNNNRPRFFGTSAAAPHAAAVAALLYEATGNKASYIDIRTSLMTTAIDMDNPFDASGFNVGFDFRTGRGLIDAEKAVEALPFDESITLTGRPGSASVELNWNAPVSRLVDFYEVFTFSSSNTQTLIGTTDKLQFTANNLQNGVTYVFRVRAVSKTGKRSSFSNNITLRPSIILNVDDDLNARQLSVYPNPSNGTFNLNLDIPEAGRSINISVTNIAGQEVMRQEIANFNGSLQSELNLNGSPAGMYILSVETEKATYRRKLNVTK